MVPNLVNEEIVTNTTYQDLIEMFVCGTGSANCMLNRCLSARGRLLSVHTCQNMSQAYEEDDTVQFNQWISTDRCHLEVKVLEVCEFIDLLCSKVQKLVPHRFVSKWQSKYLNDLKEILPDEEVILLLDFAENYTFLVQDPANSYHCNNSQATLHPICVYYKESSVLVN